jgi:hypothetical protein
MARVGLLSFDIKWTLCFPPLAIQKAESNIYDKLAEIIVTRLLVVIDCRRLNRDGWNTAWVAVNGCRGLRGNCTGRDRICISTAKCEPQEFCGFLFHSRWPFSLCVELLWWRCIRCLYDVITFSQQVLMRCFFVIFLSSLPLCLLLWIL